MPTPIADIELVKRLVVEAGKRALEHWGKIDHEFKADSSFVTAVDRDTEKFLYKELNAPYAGYAFVGEEYGWRGAKDVPVWVCDPIDGTTNYVCGLPHWGVSVGLLNEGVSQLGAVYLPALDELFWGVRGEGSYCNGIRLQVQDRDSLHVEDTICVTSNSLKTLNTEALNGRLRCLGSIAAELCNTARGSLCATIGLHEGIVDIGAALCICAEAGCEFTYLAGPPVDVAALLEARRTDEHFVYAPPRLTQFLQTVLKRRTA